MPVAKEQIRQIISENNITSVADVYSLRKRQILMRLDTKLPQPFASWSNSL